MMEKSTTRLIKGLGLIFCLLLSLSNPAGLRAQVTDTTTAHQSWIAALAAADSQNWARATSESQNASEAFGRARAWKRYLQAANQAGQYLQNDRRREEAGKLVTRALVNAQAHLDKNHPQIAAAWLWKGEFARNSGELSDAEQYYTKAQEVIKPHSGTYFDLYGNTLTGLAITNALNGHWKKAIASFHGAERWYAFICDPGYVKLEAIYNDLAITFQMMGEVDSARHYYGLALAGMERNPEATAQGKGQLMANIGLLYNHQAQFEKGDSIFKLAEQTILSVSDSEDYVLILPYNGLGEVYSEYADYQKAIDYYLKGRRVLEVNFGTDYWEVGLNYLNVGSLREQMGANAQARADYEKALDILRKQLGPDNPEVGIVYVNLGILEGKEGNLEKTLAYYREAERVFKTEDSMHPRLGDLYLNWGIELAAMDQNQEAKNLFERAELIYNEKFGPDQPELANIFTEEGHILKAKSDFQGAQDSYQKALKVTRKNFGPYHPDAQGAYQGLAGLALQQQQWEKALEYIDKAIRCLVPAYRSWGNLPSGFFYPTLPEMLAEVLKVRASILQERFLQNDNPQDLESAFETCISGLQMIDTVRRSYRQEDVNLGFVQLGLPLLKMGVDLGMACHRQTGDPRFLQKSFALADRRQATLLADAWRDQSLRNKLKLPPNLLAAEQDLKRELYRLQAEQTESGNLTTIDSVAQLQKQARIYRLRQSLDSLQAAISRRHPVYARSKTEANDFKLKSLQAKLGPDGALVEYFPSDSQIHVFLLTREGLKGRSISLPQEFSNRLLELQSHLEMAATMDAVQSRDTLNELTHFFYHTLVTPLDIPNDVKRLVIIPQGQLAYLPWEMLAPESKTDIRKTPFLLRNYAISYAYSASMWVQPIEANSSANLSFAGFAPAYESKWLAEAELPAGPAFRNGSLGVLTKNLLEVKEAQNLWGGEVFAGEQATEVAFKTVSPRSRVLHLAMHGLVDEKQPLRSRLLFSPQEEQIEDGILYAWEIYDLDLPAELAVLSACHTGHGQLTEGEGVFSLARAFRQAGCRSVMMNLWKAQDDVTAEIVTGFFKNLKENVPKDEALRQAKLSWLEQGDPLLSHPYFWAGLMVIGDNSPVRGGKQSWIAWSFLVVLLVVGSVWVIKEAQRKRSSG